MVESFIAGLGLDTREQDRALALCLLALDTVPSTEHFLEGSWLTVATTHCYTYFDGPDYDSAEVLGWMSRLVGWLVSIDEISTWDGERLAAIIDRQRQAHGLDCIGAPPAADRTMTMTQLPELASRFASTLGDPPAQVAVHFAIRASFMHASLDGTHARFGSLDPTELSRSLESIHAAEPDPTEQASIREFNAVLLQLSASFYRWLPHEGILEARRAEEVAASLSQHAMMLGNPQTPAN